MLAASLAPHSRARTVSCGSSRSCLVTRKLSGSAITSRPWARSDRATAFDEEAWAQELVVGTADSKEGIASFVERREPDFKGF